MLNIAIVGCGKIADDHAEQIQRIEGCEMVGVCDRELLMARQLSPAVSNQAVLRQFERSAEQSKAGRSPYNDAAAKPLQHCQDLP